MEFNVLVKKEVLIKVFCFKQKTAYELRISDWSSDVCSSDLLNHRTTPLDLLERMTIGDAALTKALHDLTSREDVSEAVVLSTCNRTEIYALDRKSVV